MNSIKHVIIANGLLILLDLSWDGIDYSYWTDTILRRINNENDDKEFNIKSSSKYLQISIKKGITFIIISSSQDNYIPILEESFFKRSPNRERVFSMMYAEQNIIEELKSIPKNKIKHTITLKEFLHQHQHPPPLQKCPITWERDIEEAMADQEAYSLIRSINYSPLRSKKYNNYQMIITFIISLLIMSSIFGFLLLHPGF